MACKIAFYLQYPSFNSTVRVLDDAKQTPNAKVISVTSKCKFKN
jgi:hypothetical protein